MPKPFHIYRSGAGSGKTFTLARSYLILALRRPAAFRHILGVTFTNKATEEMKNRIISILKSLSNGDSHPMKDDLCTALAINEQQLQKRAESTLSEILHQYGRFSIVTIDSFFNQVIRSFAREMGLQGTFTIDLDQSTVLERVIDKMLMEIGEQDKKQLRGWLTEFAEMRVENGQTWDFRKDITSLSGEILKDDFKRHAEAVLELSNKQGYFHQLKSDLNKVKYQFEGQVKKYCQQFFEYLDKHGLEVEDFTRKSSGPAGLFLKLGKLEIDISDSRREATTADKWLTKANLTKGDLIPHLENFIIPHYQALISYVDQQLVMYHSSQEVLRYFFTFGILAQVNQYIQKYRDENDVMLIADLPDFLHQIIKDSDTPYIYEKVGSMYENYLIDEFQDTSAFQWDNFMPLVKNAVDEGKFGMVVGDVKQSIYRFRGGDWELLQNRIKDDIGDYHVDTHTLGINWRSDPRIVSFNNAFFELARTFSEERFQDEVTNVSDEAIRSKITQNVALVFDTFADVAQEVPDHSTEQRGYISVDFINTEDDKDLDWREEATARTIEQAEELQRKGYELRDIAILTRNNREGRRIADAFIEYRNSSLADPALKYEVVSSEALFLTSSHLVRFIISLIKWLNDEKNTIVLNEWLYEYRRYIQQRESTISGIFQNHQQWQEVVPKQFIREKDQLKTLPLYELVEGIIRIFALNQLTEEFTYLQGFQDAVLDYSKNERGDIPSFLEWWEEVRKERAIQISDDNNAIKILTIHKAKGLEFPVVIMPFLSWPFDHDSNRDNILWCQSSDMPSPFNRMPVVPLKYTKKLAETFWAEEYYQEHLKAYLDNLNLLYVAFTRPVQVLIAYGQLPKPTEKSFATNHLVYQLLQKLDGWDEKSQVYRSGSLDPMTRDLSPTLEYGLEKYASNPWRDKVSLQIRGSAALSDLVFEATQEGIQMHELLSKISYADDLLQFRNHPQYEDLTALVNHELIKDWFDPKWKVSSEVPILLPGGDFKRIDRINRNDEETLVIDFKTGARRSKDEHQVRGYVKILQEMDYPQVQGYLVYLQNLEVVAV